MTYTYDPTKIGARGRDTMRFELGDTFVEGGADTCALADEEYNAILDGITPSRRAWIGAKLRLLEAILLKLSYQVDTRVDVLTYGFGERAELWRKLYEQTRKQLLANTGVPTMADSAANKPPYFHTDMQINERAQPLDSPPARGLE